MDKKPVVLEIDLGLGLQSSDPQDPVSAVRSRNVPRLPTIVSGLRHGAKDDDVVAAVVHITPQLTVWQAEELGRALQAFAAAGKRVIAWTESFGELGPGTVGYYLATAADQIWLQPSGSLGLQGIALNVMTVRGVLDKIGAEPQIGQRHEYKTAAEMYTSTRISEPNREMTGRMCDSVTGQVVSATAAARGIQPDQVTDAIAAAPLSAQQAIDRGLVDRLGYRADVYRAIREEFGRPDDDDVQIRLVFAHRYARSITKEAIRRTRLGRTRRRPIIAVVDVQGAIVTGRGNRQLPFGQPQAGSDHVIAALRAVPQNDQVRGVVLRVDSPGGSYVASDAIRHAVLQVKRSGRPVVASMGALAASGGYFVSMAADQITALPSTLTGSIGVLGGKVVIKETLNKIGIVRETIGDRPATMFSPTRVFEHDEWLRIESWLDTVYDDFTHKAAEDRGLSYDVLEPVARGRVWTGADAKERGLVDDLGGFQDAVIATCRRVGVDLDHVQVQRFPQLPMLARLRPAESSESPAAAVLGGRPPGPLETLTQALGVDSFGLLTVPWRFDFS
ncbi:S49 family peptidase [Microlunatus sp. Gsoil 973]|uniref:S49 family peptidase n=1 Tax=Microlunatus sp. Gsoil 973 TaxID=2672569 RepID=UPI0012B48901|nr:S49 family peptidase [Microlunatus sp. Gsoil 973]QGN35126.1 signal peptide peptidase SppA [Microlunatus sp. Gsoil 973]